MLVQVPVSNSTPQMARPRGEEALLVNDQMLACFTIINTWGLGQCVTILGLILNVLNIVVFIKQGLRDSVNVSLLGLSISDFSSLFFHFFLNLCWTPAITSIDLPFYPLQLMYYIVWQHILFTRVTTGITAWITFERCLCIVCPLKIKSIVTPGRTVTFIMILYIVMFSTVSPTFYTTRVGWVFESRRNKSILGVYKISSIGHIEKATFWINNILPMMLFIFISICTVILVKELKQHAQWRQQAVSSQKGSFASNRDTKVVKMVTMISIVFILCYAPGAVFFIFLFIYPQITYAGNQKNVMAAVFSVLFHLEAINATANFFIYLTVSSKFKSTCVNLFCGQFGETEKTLS